MNDVDAVLFDLDGTLCRHAGDAGDAYRRAFDSVGVEPFGEPAALWAALDGPPDPDDRVGYLGAGFARVAAQHGRTEVDPVALAEALMTGTEEIGVEFLPGAEAALDAATARGPTAVITNGPKDRQDRKIRALGLADRVDVVVYAGDLPRRKPHAAPFEEALSKLGVPAERALYVGNSLTYDVAGAQNAGLRAAWIRGDEAGPGEYRPDHVFDSVDDLVEVLSAP
ncbi:HAD family hydrolase [Halorubrum sp. N11]|uniref:HAD family hydrolase n=1 Tax=Halorubrum sp. N11 TaxID=3402276 RepID=UPI003EB82BB3